MMVSICDCCVCNPFDKQRKETWNAFTNFNLCLPGVWCSAAAAAAHCCSYVISFCCYSFFFLRWHIIKFMLCWQNDIANAKVLIKNKEIYLVGCCCQLYQFALIPFNFSAVQFNVGKVSFDVLLKKYIWVNEKHLAKYPTVRCVQTMKW